MTAISNLLFPPTYFDEYYFRLNCILVKYPAPPFRAARGVFFWTLREGFFLTTFLFSFFFLKNALYIYILFGGIFFYWIYMSLLKLSVYFFSFRFVSFASFAITYAGDLLTCLLTYLLGWVVGRWRSIK